MVGRHHQPNGHKFEQAVGDGERQGMSDPEHIHALWVHTGPTQQTLA